MKIRLCEASDREALVALTRAFEGEYLAAIVPQEYEALEAWRNLDRTAASDVDRRLRVDAGVVRTVVAEDEGGRLLGYATGRIEPHPEKRLGTWGLLEDWFVIEEASGRGLGRSLLEALEVWMRESGCSQIRATTWAFNALGRAVLERRGFHPASIEYRRAL